LNLSVTKNKNLHDAIQLNPDKIAAMLDIPPEQVGRPELYMPMIYELDERITPKVVKMMNEDPNLIESEAYARVIEQSRVPLLEIQEYANVTGMTVDEATSIWVERQKNLVNMIRKDRTAGGKKLRAFHDEVTKAFRAAQSRLGAIEDRHA